MLKKFAFYDLFVSLNILTSIIIILLSVLIGFLFPPLINGQETVTPESSLQQKESLVNLTVTEFKPEDIEARIKQIEKATDIDKNVKAELVTLYGQTLEQIQLAQEWTKKINALEQILKDAPSEIAQIKNRLDKVKADTSSQSSYKVSPKITFEELSQMLSDEQAKLNNTEQKAKKIDETINTWSNRRMLISEELAQANESLEKASQQFYDLPLNAELPELNLARKTASMAKMKAFEQKINAYKKELLSYNSVSELLSAQKEEAEFEISQAKARVVYLQDALNQRRQAKTEHFKEELKKLLAHAPEPIHMLIKENSALVHEHAELVQKISNNAEKTKEIVNKSEKINQTLTILRERLKKVEDPQFMESFFMKYQKEIPDTLEYKHSVIKAKESVSRVQTRLFELEEKLIKLEEYDIMAVQFIEDLKTHQPDLEISMYLPQVKNLFQDRIHTLESLQEDYNDYLNKLINCTIEETRLITRIESLNFLIKEHVLWLPSTSPLHETHFPRSFSLKPDIGKIIVTSLTTDMRNNPFLYVGAALIFFLWLIIRIRAQNIRSIIDGKVSKPQTDSFGLTIKEFALSILFSLGLPLLLLFINHRISAAIPITKSKMDSLIFGLSQGLNRSALSLFAFVLLKQLSRPKGIIEVHFQWGADCAFMLRKHLKWLIPVLIPMVFLVFFTQHHSDEFFKGFLSRIAYILATISIAIFIQILLHPTRGVLVQEVKIARSEGSLFLRFIWYLFGFVVPGALIITSFLGYHYTAIEFTVRIGRTFWFILGFIIIQAFIVRAVVVSRKKLMIEQASEEEKSKGSRKKNEDDGPEEIPDRALASSAAISNQTRILLRWLMVFGLLITLWVTWHDIIPAFHFISDVELWSYTVDVDTSSDKDSHSPVATKVVSVYLDDLIFSILLLMITFVVATHSPNILEVLILSRLSIDRGVRFAISAIFRYFVFIIGFIFSFKTLGIGWSKVQWLAAAVSVGLGFGLQEIFANFISGLIILFERPVRVGDFVTVGNTYGKVTNIKMRATAITDRDRRELIVPNKELITGQVINWTLSNPYTRIIVNVGIAYGSDTHLAKVLLLKAARQCRYVLKEPSPKAVFRSFGDSSLNFELRVFIADLEERAIMFDDIHTRIDNEFRDAGIEIAFPQRDIHVRSIKEELPIGEK